MLDSYFKTTFFAVGCMLIGASTWIALERFEKVPAMCLIDSQTYDRFAKQK